MSVENEVDERPRHFMKCRNPKCTSNEVYEVRNTGSSRLYMCVKCSYPIAIGVGGKVDLRSL